MLRRSQRTEQLNMNDVDGRRYYTRSSTTKNANAQRNALGNLTNVSLGQSNPSGKDLAAKPASHARLAASNKVHINANILPSRERKSLSNSRRQSFNNDAMDTNDDDFELDDEMLDADMNAVDSLMDDDNFASIDAMDVGNTQMMTEYINDMYTINMQTERTRHPSSTYMTKQRDITPKMRGILVDWLIEVHLKFTLKLETLYLTVNLLDRFLERRAVSRTKLQLVGCAAMLLACKYEEIYVPEIQDFVHISDKAYTREQMLAMETIMLNTLNFKLTFPSALKFGDRMMKVAGRADDVQFQQLVHYVMELTLQDYTYLQFLPSQMAASATYLALRMTAPNKNAVLWSPLLESYTSYSLDSLMSCANMMYNTLNRKTVKYRAVIKKYSSPRFEQVATLDTTSGFHPQFQLE